MGVVVAGAAVQLRVIVLRGYGLLLDGVQLGFVVVGAGRYLAVVGV